MVEIKVVTFKVGDEEYAIDIMKIDSVSEMMKIMHLPGIPSFILGVSNLRGEVIPIIDTRTKFSLPEKESNSNDRVVVVYISDKKVGIVVDEVREVLTLTPEQISEPPTTVGGLKAKFISAIAKLEDRMLIILDIDKIINEDEITKLDEMMSKL